MGNTTTEQKGLMSYRFRDVIREKCGFRALVKPDACLWEKQQRPEAATAAVTFRCDIRPRGRTLTHTPPPFRLKSPALVSAETPGDFFVVVKRSVPFLCGEAMLG